LDPPFTHRFQALLLNAVIPFTMAMSIIFLKTKYLKTQYAVALVIMAGVAVVIVPTIVGGGSSDNSVVFNLIFLLSTLPQAFSSIYKELAFGDIDLDVNYLVSERAAEMGGKERLSLALVVRRTGL
jgi:drug/metabolite transporter (DMT)-like permease